MFERLAFPHFYSLLAGSGALAEWVLAHWLLSRFLHVSLPMTGDAAALVLLAAGNAWAARVYRAGRGPRLRLAAAVLRGGFAALGAAAALASITALTAATELLDVLPARAGLAHLVEAERPGGDGGSWLALIAAGLAATLVGYGYRHGHRRLIVTKYRLPIAGLAPEFAGFRLVHVSDLHLGHFADLDFVQDAWTRVRALAPDIVCVTGDLVDGPATDLAAWIPALAPLDAPGGVFAILGNHDAAAGAERVRAAVTHGTHWRLLADEVVPIARGDSMLLLGGLADPEAAAVRLWPTPQILLAHHPRVFPAAAARGVALTLAGHTHGGQIAVPGLPRLNVARFFTSFDAGWFKRGAACLHVSRGVGASGQPLRIGVPAEITLIELVPA